MFNPELKIGQVLTNEEMRIIFKCGNMGGMRKSNETSSLVIISDHTKNLYEDKWDGDILHYTGMGKKGDQDINFAQNRTLNESHSNGIQIFLFEVLKAKEYIFMGKVELCAHPYQTKQKDEEGLIRNVWIYPVKVIDDKASTIINEELLKQNYDKKEQKARRLTNEEVKNKAQEASSSRVGVRNIQSKTFDRNPYVTIYAKRWADGICQLCEKPAPFINKEGEPYLETHHIEWLSQGGPDSIENTVALCPNCHKKMHVVDSQDDKDKLLKKVHQNISQHN
ncbi:HNH endonuclease [Bacillus mycoides]|uniref:HNH endonuclease n=1 Tax=Bacillus mycoides TaxID=1405 RepID=UPI001F2BB101|nr:HNH endonuclease [Bacillus mycoides]